MHVVTRRKVAWRGRRGVLTPLWAAPANWSLPIRGFLPAMTSARVLCVGQCWTVVRFSVRCWFKWAVQNGIWSPQCFPAITRNWWRCVVLVFRDVRVQSVVWTCPNDQWRLHMVPFYSAIQCKPSVLRSGRENRELMARLRSVDCRPSRASGGGRDISIQLGKLWTIFRFLKNVPIDKLWAMDDVGQ